MRLSRRGLVANIDRILGLDNGTPQNMTASRSRESRFSLANISFDESMYVQHPDPFLDALRNSTKMKPKKNVQQNAPKPTPMQDHAVVDTQQVSVSLPEQGFIDDLDDMSVVPHPFSFSFESPAHLSHDNLQRREYSTTIPHSTQLHNALASPAELARSLWQCAAKDSAEEGRKILEKGSPGFLGALSNKELVSVVYSCWKLGLDLPSWKSQVSARSGFSPSEISALRKCGCYDVSNI